MRIFAMVMIAVMAGSALVGCAGTCSVGQTLAQVWCESVDCKGQCRMSSKEGSADWIDRGAPTKDTPLSRREGEQYKCDCK